MSGIPADLLATAEMQPVEDVILAILRPRLPGIRVQTLIEVDQKFPLVLVRGGDTFGTWQGDPRFIDNPVLVVHCFTQDPGGDRDAALLGEIVRVALRDAAKERSSIPGLGSLVSARLISRPRRVTDWATATGPVQFADLPTGVTRYEARFNLSIRRPRLPSTTP